MTFKTSNNVRRKWLFLVFGWKLSSYLQHRNVCYAKFASIFLGPAELKV